LFTVLALALALAAVFVQAENAEGASKNPAKPFGSSLCVRRSSVQAKKLSARNPMALGSLPRLYGSYAKGCVAGGQAAGRTRGQTWQAMRPVAQTATGGHPEMIDYIKNSLSAKASAATRWKESMR